MKINKFFVLAVVLFSAIFAACSSDDGDAAAPDAESNTLTGRFVDSPVSGLEYITSSGLMGLTNPAGEFDYLDGDTVTFSLGPIMLGDISAAPLITPFDLVGFELPTANLNFNDLLGDILTIESGGVSAFGTGVNMLIFLQSLDNNNNPDDGINIISTIARFFLQVGAALQFDQSTEDFVAAFFALFAQLVSNNILDRDVNATPVDRDDAIRHFITANAL